MSGGSGGGPFLNRTPEQLARLVKSTENETAVKAFETALAGLLGELLASANSRDVELVRDRLDKIRSCLQSRGAKTAADGGEMERIEERGGELVVARGDGAVDFEMADHALDAVAIAIDAAVPANRRGAVGSRRNDRANASLSEAVADCVAVVALVGEEMLGPRLGERHHIFEDRAVGRFAGREVEGERDAVGVTETMNFTGEPAPRTAKRLFTSPPFAPAAETWPRTVVLSMLWRELSAIAWARVVATASQIPALLQRRKRWYTLDHLPYFSGRSRHGAPVRMRQRMPFTTGRLSPAGRLLRPRSAGNRSFSRRHSASLRSPRLTNPSLQGGILESIPDSTVNHFVNRT